MSIEIGNRIKDLRKTLNLSRSDFGKRINISASQIGCYETQYRNVPDRALNDICREFNVNSEWLLYGTGDMLTITKDEEDLAKALADITLSDNEKLKDIAKILPNLDEKYIDSIDTLIKGLLGQ